jgi:hypothetical protein
MTAQDISYSRQSADAAAGVLREVVESCLACPDDDAEQAVVDQIRHYRLAWMNHKRKID